MSLASREGLAPGTLLKEGAYIVGPILGQGGFSITYSGHERRLGAPVAIKEFFPNGCMRDEGFITPGGRWNVPGFRRAMEAFLHEGRMMARFERPGIVKVYAAFEENATAYIVMEFLQGESLSSLIRSRGVLPEPLALEFLARLADTVEGIHMAGLVHGDIKPENIMVTRDQRVVLLDFGAARNYLSTSNSALEQAALTPGYAPPEQYYSDAKIGPYTDVYALTATLYHMLGGKRPATAEARLQGEPLVNIRKLNPRVSKQLVEGLRQGLALKPTERPPSVKALMACLTGQQTLKVARQGVLANGREVAVLEGHQAWVLDLAFSPDGVLLASGSKDGTVWLWSVGERKPLGVLKLDTPVNALEISPDGKLLLCATQDGSIHLFDLASGKRISMLKKGPPPVQCLTFVGAGEQLLAGRTDGIVDIYQPPGAVVGTLEGHVGPINAVRCNAGGWMAATACNDKTIRLWDLKTRTSLRVLAGHDRVVQAVDFSADGGLLASGSNDFSIRLWDPASGAELRRLKGHEAMVWTVLFTPERNILASCSGDKTVRLWRVDTAREIARLTGHTAWVRALACSPNQRLIASGGGDNVIRLWEVEW